MSDELNTFITATPAAGGRHLGVKDLFDTAGVRTTYGSRIYAEHVPDVDAAAVRRLLAAGFSSVGKTNLHEFAYGVTSENPWYGPVRNPHDPSRVAGGSSGGSAVGAATGAFEVGLASDTAGSIRIPAALCGVVGFKPSYGAVPLEGCFPLVPWLDHAGPIARTAALCAEAFALLADRPAAVALDPSALRAGVHVPPWTQPDIAAAVRAAGDRARDAGLALAPFDPPALPESAVLLRMAAAAEVHRPTFPTREAEYGEAVARLLRQGVAAGRTLDHGEARRELDEWRASYARAAEPFDVLVLPTVPISPPLIGDPDPANRGRLLSITQPFNYLGWPAATLPCGRDALGLPTGLQLAGRDDGVVLGAALALEPVLAA